MKTLVLAILSAALFVGCEKTPPKPSEKEQQLEQQNMQNNTIRHEGGVTTPASPMAPSNPVVPQSSSGG